MSGPVPAWSGRRSPGDVFQRIVHGLHEAGRLRRTLRSQLSGGQREQQWYARPAKLFIVGKPCSFNTIGGVADTRRAFETRTKEQGLGEVVAPSDEVRRLRNHPEDNGDAKGRALPEVEGLLE